MFGRKEIERLKEENRGLREQVNLMNINQNLQYTHQQIDKLSDVVAALTKRVDGVAP